MYVANLAEIDSVPSLSAMIGNTHSQNVLEEINAKWSNNTVAFGLPSNPFNDHYKNFMNIVNHQLQTTDQIVLNTVQAVMKPDVFRPITNETDLVLMPPVMQPAMLMMPELHDLFLERKIWGWGWNPDSFPVEDQYGRLINNGKVEWDPRDKETCPEFIEWNFEQDDAHITDEMIQAVEQSRRWMADWIEKEMSEQGTRRDPTDLSNCISI